MSRKFALSHSKRTDWFAGFEESVRSYYSAKAVDHTMFSSTMHTPPKCRVGERGRRRGSGEKGKKKR
jgi:hypothetical protein